MRNTFMAITTVLIMFIIVGWSAASPTQQKPTVIGPGVLDMPIIEGSSIPDDCMVEGLVDNTPAQYSCVIYPFKTEDVDGKDWDSEYAQSLEKLGWKWAGGEANVYFFEKPIENTLCSEYLGMIGWAHAPFNDVLVAMESGSYDNIPNGLIIFSKADDQVCGDERRIK